MPAAFTRTRTCPSPGHRAFHLIDPQHVDSAELVVPDCRCHDLCISLRLEPRPAAAQAGSPMSIRCRNSCQEAHCQACRQTGEHASPDHGDSPGRCTSEPASRGLQCMCLFRPAGTGPLDHLKGLFGN